MKRIQINGDIIPNSAKEAYEFFQLDGFCPKDLELPEEDLEIFINSCGGSVFSASEIYTKLLNHKHKITVIIESLAASSASLIAMAGDEVKISPTAQIMIHNASGEFYGNKKEMEKAREVLDNTDKTIANAYVRKTGLTKEDILELMDLETWLSPQDALDYGFVDEILESSHQELVAGEFKYKEIENNYKKEMEKERLEVLKLNEIKTI